MKHDAYRTHLFRLTTGLAALLLAGTAWAHPGHHEHVHNLFAAGLTHPLTGFDHLLAMLAVGLWSALTHQNLRQAIFTPASFLVLLFCGAMAGMAGTRLPGIEPMILASLLVLGLLVASRRSVPQWASMALVGFFAVFHGLAHGAELPHGGAAWNFVVGFMLSTLALHVTGLLVGFQLKQYSHWITRLVGAGIAAYGVSLFVAL